MGKQRKQVRRHANIFAVIFGFADERKAPEHIEQCSSER